MEGLAALLASKKDVKVSKKAITPTKKKLLKGAHEVIDNDTKPHVRKATTQPNLEGVF